MTDSFFGQVPCPSKKGNLEKQICCGFTTHPLTQPRKTAAYTLRQARRSFGGRQPGLQGGPVGMGGGKGWVVKF